VLQPTTLPRTPEEEKATEKSVALTIKRRKKKKTGSTHKLKIDVKSIMEVRDLEAGVLLSELNTHRKITPRKRMSSILLVTMAKR
jgi:hypothetical protein